MRIQRVQLAANNASWENKLAQTIYHHQNSWWAKGILGFSDALNSDAGKWLLNSLHSDAAMVENLNPFNAIATAATGFDALTHQSVTTVQAYEDFAASTVGLFSGEVADAALGYAGKMLPSLGRNWAGMFGDAAGAAENMRLVSKFTAGPITPEEANADFIKNGMQPPYDTIVRPRTIRLQQERILLRVYSDEKFAAGQWMLRPKHIQGLTPDEIQDKFALPIKPIYINEVHLPVNSYLRVGRVAAQDNWGSGGAFQYQSLERLSRDCFQNPISIDEYLDQFKRGYQP